MPVPKAERAFLESIRTFEVQERALDSIRVRSRATLTAAVLGAAFLLNDSDARNGGWFVAGIVVFALVNATTLWTHRRWKIWLTNDAVTLVTYFVDDQDLDAEGMHRELALFAAELQDRNEAILRRLQRWSEAGLLLLGVEVVLLVINLAVR